MLERYPCPPARQERETPAPPGVTRWRDAVFLPELVAPWPYTSDVFEQISKMLDSERASGRRLALQVISAAARFQHQEAMGARSKLRFGSNQAAPRTQIAAVRRAGQRLQGMLQELSPGAIGALDHPGAYSQLLESMSDFLLEAKKAELHLPRAKVGPKNKQHLDGFVWRISYIWKRAKGRKATGFPAFREICLRMPGVPPLSEDGRKTVSLRASRVAKPHL